MTLERQREVHRARRRALLLLAVYALFVVLPAAHLLLHEHPPGAPLAPPEGSAWIVAACGDGCADPFHHHDAHALHATCALCQTAGAHTGLPLLAAPGPAPAAPAPLAVAFDVPTSMAPETSVSPARAPPAAAAPRLVVIDA